MNFQVKKFKGSKKYGLAVEFLCYYQKLFGPWEVSYRNDLFVGNFEISIADHPKWSHFRPTLRNYSRTIEKGTAEDLA